MACSGQGRATRSKYLQTLRNGVKSAPVARALTAHLQVRLEAEASQQALESGAVVHTVTNAKCVSRYTNTLELDVTLLRV